MPDPVEALSNAVKANDTGAVQQVLERSPTIKAKLNEALPGLPFGATALHGAVHHRNREMVDLLLAAGADINQKSHWWAGGYSVLYDNEELAPYLIDRGAIIDVHVAAQLGMMEKLDALVSANPALVHDRGGDGRTALHVASTTEIARYLLDRGADIDARDVDHESTAAQHLVRDRQDVVRFLVERGCRTDILMAAALGDVALVRQYLDGDPASVHTTVSDRYFPKHNPRSGGTIYIWTLGADKTPHHVARDFGHEEIVALLMARSPEALKLAQSCEFLDEQMVDSLLSEQPDLPKTLPESERSKLPNAARNNNAEVVRLMLATGWPVEARAQHGATALHWAAFHGNADLARTILKYGPPLEARDSDFDGTPLSWALHGSREGWHRNTGEYAATVVALLEAGAIAPPSTDLGLSESISAVLRRHAETK